MCDTVIVTADATNDGVPLLGKNSDREPNEAQYVVRVPAADHPPGTRVQCTYLDIPQVEHTYAVLLSQPFWMWGAEMGANEQGVAIGNEAVFAKVPCRKENALTGMDLLRLALERAATAREAVTVITDLIAQFGQGGNGGFKRSSYYHNSFLIADPCDAWLLETVGQHWAARQVRGVYTISNCLTIGSTWDLASPDLVTHAVHKGWCKARDDFDFARCYSDFLYTTFSDSRARRRRTAELLTSHRGSLSARFIMAVLRDHGDHGGRAWGPDKGLTGAAVCMHAGFGPIRISQTTGSMVSHLHPERATHFLTGTAAPCTGIFKPTWVDSALPALGPAPTGTHDRDALFWRHEELHRATLRDYATRIQSYAAERDDLEAGFVSEALASARCAGDERAALIARCVAESDAAEARWLEQLPAVGRGARRTWHHRLAWNSANRRSGMPPLA